MSIEPVQNPLFDEPLGMTLKHARQRKELSVEAVARQLKLPVAIIEAIEKEAWQSLGAPIYVKSYLDGYLRLLGLPLDLAANIRAPRPEPNLVAMTPSNRVKRTLDRSWRRIVYLVMTGVLVGSVAMLALHLQGRAVPAEPIALGTPLDLDAATSDAVLQAEAVRLPAVSPEQTGNEGMQSTAELPGPDVLPVAATLAPIPNPAIDGGLVIRFRGESWVDIVGANGEKLERGMMEIGAERRYAPGTSIRMTLGNASMVDVLQEGRLVDISRFSTENVARFEVSSDGRISAPGG